MYSRIIFLAITLLMSNAAFSQELSIQLSSDTARVMYVTEAFGQDFGRLELEAGMLHKEGGDDLINLGLLVRGESVSAPVIVAIGARGYYADIKPYTVAAIAIGADVLLSPEQWGGFGMGGYFYTAPSVVSFSDAEDLTEYGLYLNFQITPQARVTVGYQRIDIAINNAPDVTFDKGSYFGLNISF